MLQSAVPLASFSAVTHSRWTPASVIALRHYTRSMFAHDVLAGVTVGLVALPLAMAFAIASGLTPQSGIYCAIVTGFIISALGGSKFQIGGPTGAFVVVVAGIVATYGIDGLFMCTMRAGVILVVLGATGMGAAVSFIPRPVVVGFTNGIAVLIASTQIRDFFGLQLTAVPGSFWPRMLALAEQARTFSPPTTALAVGALVCILVWNRFVRGIPGYIVVLLAGTVAVVALKLPVETIGSRFGGIPRGWPPLIIPTFHVSLIPTLASPALTIALLARWNR
jgi:sulfate permease, SulP family